MNKTQLTILLFVASNFAWAQKKANPGFGNHGTQEVCSQLSFSSDEDVTRLVNQILDYAGVANRSYEVRGCTNASGCFATVINDQQYIVYQPDYLKTVKKYGFTASELPKENKDWEALTILAHEVGHLINGHFYKSREDLTPWGKELQADGFAGKIIYHLNGTLPQALSVYNSSLVPENGTMAHPPRKERLGAVTNGYNNAQKLFPRTTKNNDVPALEYAEVMPEFNGNLGAYLSESLTYPAIAQESNIEGRVVVKFVVDETGAVSDAVVTRSVHPALDAEALRVVKAMPRWKPGTQQGIPVMVYYTLPIVFKLEDPEPVK